MRSAQVEEVQRLAGQLGDFADPHHTVELLATLRTAVDRLLVLAVTDVQALPAAQRSDSTVVMTRAGLTEGEATGLSLLAHDLPAMPGATEALADCTITVPKARLLQGVHGLAAYADGEAALIASITGRTLRCARTKIRQFRLDHDPRPEGDADRNHATSGRTSGWRGRVLADLDDTSHAIVDRELRRLAEHYRDGTLTQGQRLALALVEMARRSVAHNNRGTVGSRPELVIVAHLNAAGGLSGATRQSGAPVERSVFEHMSCDATIRALLVDGENEPLDLGRSQRLASAGQRRALAVRDKGCAYPGCWRPPDDCEVHHIKHWTAHHGPTDLDNLVLLCRHHHHFSHHTGLTSRIEPGGTWTITHANGDVRPGWPRASAA